MWCRGGRCPCEELGSWIASSVLTCALSDVGATGDSRATGYAPGVAFSRRAEHVDLGFVDHGGAVVVPATSDHVALMASNIFGYDIETTACTAQT